MDVLYNCSQRSINFLISNKMLKGIIIGWLGADASIIETDGSKFVSARVAHTDMWKDSQGVAHSNTIWVDIIIKHDSPVVPYLRKGTQVYVEGSISLRVYSSEKDRCQKAGMTIHARSILLLSSKPNDSETSQKQEEKPYDGF